MEYYILLIGLTLFLNEKSYADPRECTQKDDIEGSRFLDDAKTWENLYEGYKKFAQCDDGEVAEGFTDLEGQLLSQNWGEIGRVSDHIKADVNFKSFLLKTVRGPLTRDQGLLAKKNAKNNCPKELKDFCRDLIRNIGKIAGER